VFECVCGQCDWHSENPWNIIPSICVFVVFGAGRGCMFL